MSGAYTPEEPIAAIATALAPSALAAIRTSGKNCIELVAAIFSRPKALRSAAGYTMVHGWIVTPQGDRIDEVMLGVYRAPKSFTGEDMVEIFCHGGTASVLAVQKLLLKSGFREAERGEFSFRAYINGKTDLTRAEAIREIIDSRTDESRSRAAGRLAGNLYQEMQRIKELLIRTAASIEAEIEYPEDENAIADAYDESELIEAGKSLKRLSDAWAGEKLYQDGARIVLCGKTNAGKSSLFNTLLKEERAIVSDIEGTTRDWIESWVSFGGIPARLFDTAGLRKSDDIIEQSGVERSLDLVREADLVLYLADSTKELAEDDKNNLAELAESKLPVILVWNKCDKPSASTASVAGTVQEVRISAKTGEGLSSLIEAVHGQLAKQEASSRDQAGLGSERQKACVDDALDSINHALSAVSEGLGLDAVVQDIEDALAFLSAVTGEVSPDDILGNIFSRFCVGK